jgi:hypothetical protein
MTPQANKISGPGAIRYLLTASEVYQHVVKDTVAVIQDAIDDGTLVERESAYSQLMLALMAVERDLSWVAERSHILLGEQVEEGEMGDQSESGRS